MIIRVCKICGKTFEASYPNQQICETSDLLCRKINVYRGKKRSAENLLAPLEAMLLERKATC